MSAPALNLCEQRDRLGLKGPRAAEWLAGEGIVLPAAPNSWVHSQESMAPEALLVARLGAAEFFLEDAASGTATQTPRELPEPAPAGRISGAARGPGISTSAAREFTMCWRRFAM